MPTTPSIASSSSSSAPWTLFHRPTTPNYRRLQPIPPPFAPPPTTPLPHPPPTLCNTCPTCVERATPKPRNRRRPSTPRSIKRLIQRCRTSELAGMMGVSDQGINTRNQVGSNSVESIKAGDDPLDNSPIRTRTRDVNDYPTGLVSSSGASTIGGGSIHFSQSNDDSISQMSNRTMLYPIIKVRPEYDTVYRKGIGGDQNDKQNVVCVVSIEVPSRRAGASAEEEDQLWFQRANKRFLGGIQDDGNDNVTGAVKDYHGRRNEEDGQEKESGNIATLPGRRQEKQEDDEAARKAEPEPQEEEEEEEEPFSFGATPAIGRIEKLDPFANIVEDLRKRITDWKGHTVDRFGPLVLYDFLGVRQENVVREFYVYLFEEALLCVTEEKRKEKKLARLIGSDKASSVNGSHHFDDLSNNGTNSGSSSGRSNKPALKLKGRIWLRHIRKCQEIEVEGAGYCLSIKLDDESLDHFVLCLKENGHRQVWKDKMNELLLAYQKPKEVDSGTASSNRKAMQELPSPAVQIHDVFEDAKGYSITRRQTTASTSGHSVQSGKSGSNNVLATSNSSAFASPTSVTSPRQALLHSSMGEQDSNKLNFINGRPNFQTSIPGLLPGLPQYQQWSASGGLDPSLPTPDLLAHTPIDLVIMVSVPSVAAQPTVSSSTLSSSAALKVRLMRSTLDFVITHLGPNDRIALVAYNVGVDGLIRRTSLLNSCKVQSREKLEQFIDTIGKPWEGPGEDPFQEDIDRLGGNSDRTDTVTAVNIGFDIVLQRKSKNPITGMLLINDTADAPRRGQMDLVMARAEAANVPVHCFGFGKSHDPSSLWLISNHTRGSYTFVKEWYQLRECVSGCIGSMMSVALTDVKLHISVPFDNHFKVRKVAGPSGAIISSSGKDVDIELGELRFGDCKELFVELELDFNLLLVTMQKNLESRGNSRTMKKTINDQFEKGSATDDFMQRLGLQGLSISTEEEQTPPNSYDQAAIEANFIEEVAVLEVDCGCKDPSLGSSVNRIPIPGVLTLEVNGTSLDPITQLATSGSANTTATALADPVVTRRRLEILVSDMITRCLLLVSRRNHTQALTILLETRRIVDTVLQAIPVVGQQQLQMQMQAEQQAASMSRHTSLLTMSNPSLLRNSQAKKQKELLHRKTALSLLAILEDLDVLIDGLETNQNVSFERTQRNFGAQQAMVLRDQKAWTSRTDTEWQFHRNIDNAAPFAALAAAHAVSGRGR